MPDSHYLYLLLNIASPLIPFLFSFEKKIRFCKQWRYVLPSIFLVAIVFIAWDIYFTKQGYWGFNENYVTGIELFGLPLSELLFFITIPYACIFIYEALRVHVSGWAEKFPYKAFLILFFLAALALNLTNFLKPYTFSATTLAMLITGYLLYTQPKYTPVLCLAYVVSIIPFLVVNGTLTGSWIPGEVVWYNDAAFSGWRLFRIPLEDFFYSFDLIVGNILLIEWLRHSVKSANN